MARVMCTQCNMFVTQPCTVLTCPLRWNPDKTHLYTAKDAPTEAVDHPSHYGGADNPFEVIKVMEAWLTREEFIGAMKFNIHKYTARADKKGRAEDYAKAAWYNNHLVGYIKRHPE